MALRDVIGQEKAVNILLKTLQRGRIPSAYLFAGESGIGKKFTAINLAKALNCLKDRNELGVIRTEIKDKNSSQITHHASQIDACDECSSCKKIESGVHPDIQLIFPEGGQIRIDEIRTIEEALSLKAFEGRWKVVIVEKADTMNLFAANAFLKTLEEPPAGSLIILISSIPDRFPETIRSRCSRINFSPLPYKECKKIIKTAINKQSMVNAQKDKDFESRLSVLTKLSMGRPGLAVSTDLLEEREWFLKLFREMMKAEKDGWTSKEEMEKWFEYLIIFLRDLTIKKITEDNKALINIDIEDYIKNFSSGLDLKVIIESYQKLSRLKGYFNFNLNKSLIWNYTGSLLRILKAVRL